MTTTLHPYETGYRAACADQLRQAPGGYDEAEGRAWLIGYDDAVSDNEAERAAVLASFSD